MNLFAYDNPTNCARWQFVANYIFSLPFIAQHVIDKKLVLSLTRLSSRWYDLGTTLARNYNNCFPFSSFRGFIIAFVTSSFSPLTPTKTTATTSLTNEHSREILHATFHATFLDEPKWSIDSLFLRVRWRLKLKLRSGSRDHMVSCLVLVRTHYSAQP